MCRQLAGLSELQYNLDAAHAAKRARTAREETALRRLQTPAAQLLPAVWRGKAYRRAELAALATHGGTNANRAVGTWKAPKAAPMILHL